MLASSSCMAATISYVERPPRKPASTSAARIAPSSTQDELGFRHCLQLTITGPARQVVEAARAGHDRLLGCEPFMHLNAFRDRFAAFDFGILDVHRPDAELLVADQALVVRGHVVLDEVG